MKKTFKASEFEEGIARVVDDVISTQENAVITKNGIPVAEIVPVKPAPLKKRPKSIFGAMKGKIIMKDDIIAPAWDGDFGDPN